MRTKILASAAILAVGTIASVAQSNVYSLNVVGYYNIPVPANTKILIANSLDTTNNTLGGVIPSPVPGSQFFKYNSGYASYAFDDADLVWVPDGDVSLAPGEGGFFISPAATTLTFVGEVKQGALSSTLPIGLKVLRGSVVPQAGLVTTTLGLPGEGGDQLFTYNGGFTSYAFDDADFVWVPEEPNIAVGQGFFYQKAPTSTTNTWARNFTVQ
jgi:hypothetical protein